MKLNIQLFASDGAVIIDADINTKSFDAQIDSLESKLEQLEGDYKIALKDPDFDESQLQDMRKEIEQTSNKLVDLYNKKELLNKKDTFNGFKGAMDDIIKKVGKWTLAVFGIRSAYNFVRQSISTISQYNKNLAKDIENIRYGLASALQPIIQKIVEWAYRLMQAINYVWRILTGKNLFSNIKKDLNASNKSAKQLQKTIASFDEMNVLNDNKTGGGGGSGASGLATEDLTATNLLSEQQKKVLEDIAKVLKDLWSNILQPMWEKVLKPIGEWLLKHPKVLLGLLTAIIGLKIASKIGALGGAFSGLTSALGGVGKGGLIGALALLDYFLIDKIVKDIKDELIPTIKDTKERIENATKGIEGTTKATQDVSKEIIEYASNLDELNDTQRVNNDILLRQVTSNKKLIKQHKDDISLTGALTGENKMHKKAIEELNKQTNLNVQTLGKLAEMKMLTNEQAQEYVNLIDEEIIRLEKENQKLPENSKKYEENKTKIQELKTQLDKTQGNYNVNVKTSADKTKVDNLAKAVNKVEGTHNVKFDADTNKANKKVHGWLSKMGSSLFSTFFPTLSFATILAKFKYHAKGGIINQPNRGIPIDMGGESGREGIVPLTDSQQMALLGEAIGKYVNINATIINQMNGRIISRELQKLQNESNFANNR